MSFGRVVLVSGLWIGNVCRCVVEVCEGVWGHLKHFRLGPTRRISSGSILGVVEITLRTPSYLDISETVWPSIENASLARS